jgi:hypothetical protein
MTDDKSSPNGDNFLDHLLQGGYSGGEGDAAEDQEREKVESALEKIADEAPQEGDSGSTKVFVKNLHIQLGKITKELVKTLVELGLSGADPTHITKVDALRRLGMFLWKIRDRFQKVDLEDRDVCRAVAAVTLRKKESGKVLIAQGANSKEVEEDFESRQQMAPDRLPERLENLTDRGVLKREPEKYEGPFYQVVF